MKRAVGVVATIVCCSILIAAQQGQSPSSPGPSSGTASPQAPQGVDLQPPVQGAPLPSTLRAAPPVADSTTYRFFFLVMANLEDYAAKKEAAGKDGSKLRTLHQQAAGLSEEEGRILSGIKDQCNQDLAAVNAKIGDAIKALRADFTPEKLRNMPPPADLLALFDQRNQIVNSAIDELKVELGNESFQKLDDYVKKNFRAGVVASGKAAGGAQ